MFNGGTSWIEQVSGTFNYLVSVHMITANDVVVAGDGIILRTTDGGGSWTPTPSAVGDLRDVRFATPSIGIASTRNRLHRTADGGGSWTAGPIIGTSLIEFGGIWFADADSGVVVGDSSGRASIYRSTNRGVGWNAVAVPAAQALYEVSFFGLTEGYAVGRQGNILRTADGGRTWTQEPSPTTADLFGVWATSASHAVAVSVDGKVFLR